MSFRNIIVEGIDRVGKDTLIAGLLNSLGYHYEVHYTKPKLLDKYKPAGMPPDIEKREALRIYQLQTFLNMFVLLGSRARLILNRAHLGEYVYAQRYRGYVGDYIFKLEQEFIDGGSDFHKDTLLVMLHTTDSRLLTEDGNSLGGLDKRMAEMIDFHRAFERSAIIHKVCIDVNDSRGQFVPKEKILETVLQAYRDSPSWNEKTWYVSWTYDDPYAPGQLQRAGNLVGNPSKAVQ